MTELLGKPIKIRLFEELKKRVSFGEKFTGYVIYNAKSYEASEYARLISKVILELGLNSYEIQIRNSAEAEAAIKKANEDPIGSIFLCRPLLVDDEACLIEAIDPQKDADMLTSANAGKLVKGDLAYLSGTSSSVKKIIEYYNLEVTSKKSLIIGRSVSVGMPIALMMIKKNALVSVVHSKISADVIEKMVSESDIVILCTGQRGLVLEKDIRPNQIIIDCGFLSDGRGALGFIPTCQAFTPVPGGVGPVTILSLAENALNLLKK